MKRKHRIILYLVVGLIVFVPSWIIYGNVREIIVFPLLVLTIAVITEIIKRNED